MPHCPSSRPGVAEPDVLELEPPTDRDGHEARPGLGHDPRLHVEEAEQVREVQALLEDLRHRQQDPLDQVAALAERARQERQRADGEPAEHRQINRDGVRAVVTQRADRDEHGGDDVTPDGEPLVLLVELIRQRGVAAHEEVRQAEKLDLLGHLVRRAGVAQVIEQPSLGRPLEQEGITERREVRLAEKRRQHRHDEEEQQPRELDEQHAREGGERDEVLSGRQEQRDQPQPPHRLAARALQMIVRLGVLVLRQVERRRVLHQPHADPVREQVSEQALEQRRQPGEPLSCHGDAELQYDQPAQIPPVHRLACRLRPHAGDDPVDDQLPDPQHRERHERPHRAQRQDGDGVSPVGLVDQLQEWWDVLQGLEPLAPGRGLSVATRNETPGAWKQPVRDETRGARHIFNAAMEPCVNITA